MRDAHLSFFIEEGVVTLVMRLCYVTCTQVTQQNLLQPLSQPACKHRKAFQVAEVEPSGCTSSLSCAYKARDIDKDVLRQPWVPKQQVYNSSADSQTLADTVRTMHRERRASFKTAKKTRVWSL